MEENIQDFENEELDNLDEENIEDFDEDSEDSLDDLDEDSENLGEELFRENPLKAIFYRLGEIKELIENG